MTFNKRLINWFKGNKRDLPWRKTRDPFKIWLSEVILQQTRVDQGMQYYFDFVNRFEDVHQLADADEREIIKLWQGLGYYSRARNLHAAAQYVSRDLKGKFPDTYNDLLKMKGVGKYTAAAVASIAYGEVVPVVDGNVYRVLSRYLGIDTPINKPQAHKEFTHAATELMAGSNPSDFNQALMEFGALHCTPQNPDCKNCPFQDECYAFNKGEVKKYPIKTSKTKVKTVYFEYLILLDNEDNLFIKKREHEGIWKNMYDFPLIESEKKLDAEKLFEHRYMKTLLKEKKLNRYEEPQTTYKHILSHRKIFARFHQFYFEGKWDKPEWVKVSKQQVSDFPLPRLIDKYVHDQDWA